MLSTIHSNYDTCLANVLIVFCCVELRIMAMTLIELVLMVVKSDQLIRV